MTGSGSRGRGRLARPGRAARGAGVHDRRGRVRVIVDDARKRLPEIFRHLHERGVPVSDVAVTEPTLESVFIELAR